MKMPLFRTPAPEMGEMIPIWHLRIGEEFERFVNEELVPALAAAQTERQRDAQG